MQVVSEHCKFAFHKGGWLCSKAFIRSEGRSWITLLSNWEVPPSKYVSAAAPIALQRSAACQRMGVER